MSDRWVTFEGYDGRYDPRYGGGYVAGATAADRVASLLLPVSSHLSRRHLGDGVTLDVVPLRFQLWSGPPLRMSEDCNKRGGRIVGQDGDLSCAEVEIVRRLRAIGWDAAWVSPFRCGERRWGTYRLNPSALPASIRALEARIGMGRGGRPDVVAWSSGRVCYLESKGPADSIRPTQVTWFAAALRAGLAESDLALSSGDPPDTGEPGGISMAGVDLRSGGVSHLRGHHAPMGPARRPGPR